MTETPNCNNRVVNDRVGGARANDTCSLDGYIRFGGPPRTCPALFF
jgi:hypothetical protein